MVTDLQSTLDAIDTLAVHQCGQCDRALPEGSVSLYWCDDVCQEAWNTARAEALVGYKEPTDLAVHYSHFDPDDVWIHHCVDGPVRLVRAPAPDPLVEAAFAGATIELTVRPVQGPDVGTSYGPVTLPGSGRVTVTNTDNVVIFSTEPAASFTAAYVYDAEVGGTLREIRVEERDE